MPKLNTKKAKSVEQAASGFEAIPDGTYRGRLKEVTPGTGGKGIYWRWTFVISEGESKGRQLFVNTSLADNAEWKLKEIFDAFGVPANTDTDELLGEEVLLVVSQKTIQSGSRMGEMGNNVDRVVALGEESDETDWTAAASDDEDDDAEEDDEPAEATAQAATGNGPARGRKPAAAAAGRKPKPASGDEEEDPFA